MKREGVVSTLDTQKREEGDTGQCLVMVTPDADRTMNTYLGITGDLGAEQIDESALSASEWLYIEGYLVSTDPAREAAIVARKIAEEKNVKTALSLSDPNMVRFFGDGLKAMLGERVNLLLRTKKKH